MVHLAWSGQSNIRNIIILAVVAVIIVVGAVYYYGDLKTAALETPATAISPSPDASTPPANTPEGTPAATPDAQPTPGASGQQN